MRTLTEFCDKSHLPEGLIRAVVRQSGGWSEWDQTARDVTRGGADGGFHGFIYYTDTVPFARRNRDAILEMAKQQAEDMGAGDEFQMIVGFNCLKGQEWTPGEVARTLYDTRQRARRSDNDVRGLLWNALAWYALEEVARSYCDLIGAD